MWEYEAPEAYYDLVGLGIAFCDFWSPGDSWSRIEILNEETGEWLPPPKSANDRPRYVKKRASWDDARRMAPEFVENEVIPAS